MIKNITFVIPSYNESENINELYLRIKIVLKDLNINDYEIIYIENGSTDNSLKILKELNLKDQAVKVISFTRNFGLQNAIHAGLNYATKDYVCVMDGDLQDPPELLKDFSKKINDGYDVVYGIRKKRKASLFKRVCYKIFYYFFSNLSEIEMPSQVGEFCIMKREVVNILREFKEKNLFIRGLRTWIGFKQTGVEYTRPERNAGREKFNFFSSFFFGLDGIISFSIFPLRIILLLGSISSIISILFSIFIFLIKILSIFQLIPSDALLLMPKGLTATTIFLLISFSLIILSLGIIGEYIAKIYFEVKQRPNYIIKELIK
jgi:dolichol-phosphate mannosyltransferase